MSQGA